MMYVANALGNVLGTLYLYNRDVFVLLDTGSTHSMVSLAFYKHLKVPSTPLNHALSISTPMGNIVVISYEFKNYPLSVGDNIRSANLLPLEMSDFDIILGMDWLTKNRATIDCHLKRIIFGYLNNLEFIYHGSRPAKIEAMNLILISIPNDIYNSVDACKTAKAMWQRVKRLMRETMQNKVDRETRFNNEFDQFVVEPGEALVTTTTYYVTHPSSVVDNDDDYQGDAIQNNSEDPLTPLMILLARAITQHFSNLTNNRLRTSSNTKNQAIVQGDRVNIQSKNSRNNDKNIRRSYFQEEIIEGNNVQNDAGNIQITL
ncbi:copia protein [Tanacetum coccineum]